MQFFRIFLLPQPKDLCQRANDSDRIERTLKEIDKNSCELLEYNDILTRKLIECVRVVSKTEIQIIFKGGYEVAAEVEK